MWAAFKAGVTPSRIARQFGLSQSDVRKALSLMHFAENIVVKLLHYRDEPCETFRNCQVGTSDNAENPLYHVDCPRMVGAANSAK